MNKWTINECLLLINIVGQQEKKIPVKYSVVFRHLLEPQNVLMLRILWRLYHQNVSLALKADQCKWSTDVFHIEYNEIIIRLFTSVRWGFRCLGTAMFWRWCAGKGRMAWKTPIPSTHIHLAVICCSTSGLHRYWWPSLYKGILKAVSLMHWMDSGV